MSSDELGANKVRKLYNSREFNIHMFGIMKAFILPFLLLLFSCGTPSGKGSDRTIIQSKDTVDAIDTGFTRK